MPPKSSNASTNNKSDDVLSVSWITGGGEVDLLRRLLATSSHLESLTQQRSNNNINGTPSILSAFNKNNNNNNNNTLFSKEFLDELLRRTVLRHPNPEVRLVVGCILADVLRLSLGPMTSVAASSPNVSLPWKSATKDQNADIIQLIIGSLTSTQPTAANLPFRRHILESLSVTHALIPLIRAAKLSEKDQGSFFNGLLLTNSAAGTSATSTVDDSYASYASSALCDLLSAAQSISENQVETIVAALGGNNNNIAATTAAANSVADATDGAVAPASTSSTSSSSSMKKIASSLLRRNDLSNQIQSALVPVVAGKFEEVSKELNENDVAGDQTDAQKRLKLRELGALADRLTDLAQASPTIVALLLPKMSALTSSLESNDARGVLVRGLARAFTVVPALALEYQGSLFNVCHLVNDSKATVRQQVVALMTGVLTSHASSSSSSSSSSTIDILWNTLSQHISRAVQDGDEGVRKNALSAVIDLARLCPDRIPTALLLDAGARIHDKRPAVRALAMEKFAVFYQNFRPKYIEKCSWIPNKIIEEQSLEDGDDFNIERVFESLLPPPTRYAADLAALSEDASPGGSKKKKSLFGNSNSQSNNNTNSKQQATLFDLGFNLAPGASATNKNNNNNNQDDAKPGSKTSFIEGLLTFVEDLNEQYHGELFRLMTKKFKLRQCVSLLFETREEAKKFGKAQIDSDEGVEITDKIRRLINVLRKSTKAPEIMWDTLFKLRDERAVKGLLALASGDNLDFLASREDARSRLGASLKKDVMTWVETVLLPRLCLPLTQTHISELVQEGSSLRETLNRLSGAAENTHHHHHQTGKKNNQNANSNNDGEISPQVAALEKRYRSVVDCLYCVQLHSPQLLNHHAKDLISWITIDGDREHPESRGAALGRLVEVFTAVGTSSGVAHLFNAKDTKKSIATALGKLCLYSRSGVAAVAAADSLAKVYSDDTSIFKQFVPALQERLSQTTKQGFAQWSPFLAGWLAVFTHLCQNAAHTVGAIGKDIYGSCVKILLAACRGTTAGDATEASLVSAKKNGALLLNTSTKTVASTIVSASALALVAYADALSNSAQRNPTLNDTFQLLLDALKAASLSGSDASSTNNNNSNANATIGGALKRLAILKAMLTLCESPPVPVSNETMFKTEISTAICISSESNNFVRAEVQKFITASFNTQSKLGSNSLHIDVRYLALLIVTAVSEEQRGTYNFARAQLACCVQRMQKLALEKFADVNIPFSDPRSFKVHAEYTVPFLVIFLAHHSFFDSEKKSGNFNAFQRVFHLLFDVIFKTNTNTVHFIQEMLRKMKGYDDALAPTSSNTREIVDLAAKVLQQFLSQRQVSNGAYPGQVLLPRCFVSNAKSQFKTEQVYLGDEVAVGVQVPFRAAPSVTPSKFGGLASLGASDDDDNDNNINNQLQEGFSAQRRNRYQSSANANDKSENEESKPQNDASPKKALLLLPPAQQTPNKNNKKNNNTTLEQDSAPASVSKNHAKNFPAPPKGMNKTVANVIRSLCEVCNSTKEILGMKMKTLTEKIQEKTGEKPSDEVKSQVKEYAASIVQYFLGLEENGEDEE